MGGSSKFKQIYKAIKAFDSSALDAHCTGVDLNQFEARFGETHATPLLIATQLLNNPAKQQAAEAVIRVLLKHGANPFMAIPEGSRRGLSPFHVAIKLAASRIALLFLISKDNFKITDISWFTEAGMPLSVFLTSKYASFLSSSASQKSFFSVLKSLLLAGADINALDKNQSTALLSSIGQVAAITVQSAHHKLIEKLLKLGANPNIAGYQGSTPLALAAYCNLTDILELLLRQPHIAINYQGEDGSTALYMAAQNGHLACVDSLLTNKAKVNIPHTSSMRAIDIAASDGHTAIVKRLQAAGSEPINTSLVFSGACADGQLRPIAHLIDDIGESPDTMALCRMTTLKGNPFSPENSGLEQYEKKSFDAPLIFIASLYSFDDIFNYLLTKNVNVNYQGPDGRTPLTNSVLRDRPDRVTQLIASGADDTVNDSDITSAFVTAIRLRKFNSIAALMDFTVTHIQRYSPKVRLEIHHICYQAFARKDFELIDSIVSTNGLSINLQVVAGLTLCDLLMLLMPVKLLSSLTRYNPNFDSLFQAIETATVGKYYEPFIFRIPLKNIQWLWHKNFITQHHISSLLTGVGLDYQPEAESSLLVLEYLKALIAPSSTQKVATVVVSQQLFIAREVEHGKSTRAYLTSLGYSSAQIKALRDSLETSASIASASQVAVLAADHYARIKWFAGTLSASHSQLAKIENADHLFFLPPDNTILCDTIPADLVDSFGQVRPKLAVSQNDVGLKRLSQPFPAQVKIGQVVHFVNITCELKIKSSPARILYFSLHANDSRTKLLIPCLFLKNGLHNTGAVNRLLSTSAALHISMPSDTVINKIEDVANTAQVLR